MMIFNQQMENILQGISLEKISSDYTYPIKRRTTMAGEPYWSITNDNTLLSTTSDKLIDYEWYLNEVWLSDNESITQLVIARLNIIYAW